MRPDNKPSDMLGASDISRFIFLLRPSNDSVSPRHSAARPRKASQNTYGTVPWTAPCSKMGATRFFNFIELSSNSRDGVSKIVWQTALRSTQPCDAGLLAKSSKLTGADFSLAITLESYSERFANATTIKQGNHMFWRSGDNFSNMLAHA